MLSFLVAAPEPEEAVSYECQWSGDWSPIPGCAIEVDVNYAGLNLNQATAKEADRQPDAHACQAFCRASNARYFKWVSPELNITSDQFTNSVHFACFCKSNITARLSTHGVISGAASDCGVDCASANATSNCTDAGKHPVQVV